MGFGFGSVKNWMHLRIEVAKLAVYDHLHLIRLLIVSAGKRSFSAILLPLLLFARALPLIFLMLLTLLLIGVGLRCFLLLVGKEHGKEVPYIPYIPCQGLYLAPYCPIPYSPTIRNRYCLWLCDARACYS